MSKIKKVTGVCKNNSNNENYLTIGKEYPIHHIMNYDDMLIARINADHLNSKEGLDGALDTDDNGVEFVYFKIEYFDFKVNGHVVTNIEESARIRESYTTLVDTIEDDALFAGDDYVQDFIRIVDADDDVIDENEESEKYDIKDAYIQDFISNENTASDNVTEVNDTDNID